MLHKIQLVGIFGESNKERMVRIGFVVIKDREEVVFNPMFQGVKKLHWTWHKNGLLHSKDNDGKKLFECKRIPLDKFKGQSQMLCSAIPTKDSDDFNLRFLEYKKVDNTQIFAIDLRNHNKLINISLHVCAYNQILKCVRNDFFRKKKNHQVFVYMKSTPYLVIHTF